MTDRRQPNELRPLRDEDPSDLERGHALLSGALCDLYPTEDTPLAPESWEALAPIAESVARTRRRRYFGTRLLGELEARQVLGYAAMVLLFLIGLVLVGRFSRKPVNEAAPPLLAARAELKGTAARPQAATLINGATIEASGEIKIDQHTHSGVRIAVKDGSFRATVPHLPDGEAFIVTTDTSEITVHGTRFMVQQQAAGQTTVSVESGLVSVQPLDGRRPKVLLHPGEQVSVVPFAQYLGQLANEVAVAVEAGDCGQADTMVQNYLAVADASTDVSAARYLLGVCAARRGHYKEAIEEFDRVAGHTDVSIRADNASARAAQLRAQRDDLDGAVAWKRYLERFPRGAHVDLAREFLKEHATRPRP
jgi:hypothetical protein